MQIPADAVVSHEASIQIAASPEQVYDMVADVGRMGEWSPEATGGDWVDGGTGKQGEWFEGHNKSGEREWSRACQVAKADRGRDFTFVVGGIEDNCTWWSYEMDAVDGGTQLTERWWYVNMTPGLKAATPEQLAQRIVSTETMLQDTIAGIKKAAES